MEYLNTIIILYDTSTILIYKKSLLSFVGGFLFLLDVRVPCCWPLSGSTAQFRDGSAEAFTSSLSTWIAQLYDEHAKNLKHTKNI
jgi:hypothetical protein